MIRGLKQTNKQTKNPPPKPEKAARGITAEAATTPRVEGTGHEVGFSETSVNGKAL